VKRVPAEYTILVSFAATAFFWAWLIFFGSWRTSGNSSLALILLCAFLGLGVTACWLLLKQKVAGAWLAVIFYGIQILSFPLPVGAPLSFHSLPTLYFRVNGDPSAPISVNVVGVVLFLVSLVLLAHYREREASASQVLPNTSFERTREG
jgi:hypothetical protein